MMAKDLTEKLIEVSLQFLYFFLLFNIAIMHAIIFLCFVHALVVGLSHSTNNYRWEHPTLSIFVSIIIIKNI